MKCLAVFCLCVTLTAAGPTYLVKADLLPGQSGAELSASGLTVLRDYGTWCLVLAASEQLHRTGLTLLDELVPERVWLWVLAPPDWNRDQLACHGRILLEEGRSVLLATTEAAVDELNRLPVELSRVGTEPLVYAETPISPPPLPVVSDSLVWSLVDKVSEDSVLATIRRLQNFYTRYSTTDSCRRAVEWMRQKFIAYGCDSTALETFRSGFAPNVIGVKKGKLDPTKIYIICGHADNTSNQQPNRCPGADDNASGATAVLEACRVFQGIDFDYTVYFIGFTGEEQGLYGSDSFASRAYRRRDSIRAVLNFDMISYARMGKDTLEVIGRSSSPNCTWLVDFYRAQCDTFGPLKTKKIMTTSNQYDYSDHAPFWWKGYVAFCGIEHDFTPKYHTIGDTIGPLYEVNCGTNNWPMATRAIRAAVASLAKLAGARVATGITENPPSSPPVGPSLRVQPNPFSKTARLMLTNSLSELKIYNSSGRLVRTLAARQETAGKNWAVWDGYDNLGNRVSSGIYLCRATGPKGILTATLVLTD